MNSLTDRELVRALLDATSESSQSEVGRLIEGITQDDMSRWRRGDWKRLSASKRGAIIEYLESRGPPQEEPIPMDARTDFPNVAGLQPRALAFYHQTLGEFTSKGWTSETLAAAARAMTAFLRAEATLASEGPGRPDLTEEEQLVALRATRRAVELAYGRTGLG